jgi:hypothetical protein
MANYDFKKDINIGEAGEVIVRLDLESVGGTFISDNKDNKYDLLMNMPIRGSFNYQKVSYEIKTDVYCRPHMDTGNLFVEFESRGSASGITVSEADWFVTYFEYFKEIWYIKTSDLKKLILNNKFKKTELSGDLNSNTKGYLIPRYQFKKHFKVRTVKKKLTNQY